LGCGIWDLNGNELYNFCKDGAKMRVNDLAISPDGQRLVVVAESSILIYDFRTYNKICEWDSNDIRFTSVSISQDSRHLLFSLDKIHLIDIATGSLIRSFEGHEQKQYVIRSDFGGADQNFVVSGSEDSKIYIWRSNGYVTSRLLSEHLAEL
jgi:WD40 repeat protein